MLSDRRSNHRNAMKKKLLIINQNQFGYHSDTYYYCKYLRNTFDITYLCWDYKKSKISPGTTKVIYTSRNGSKTARNLRFLMRAVREIRKSYNVHIIKYFRGCSLLKLIYPQKAFLLDIRSGAVGTNPVNRISYELGVRIEPVFFENVSIISKGLATKLGLLKKAFILPLGADKISVKTKAFDCMSLLYVGTLQARNIHQALQGYIKFHHEYHRQINLKFTIVGSGFGKEENRLKEIAGKANVNDSVSITGHIPHDQLQSFFDSHNIGVSHIPKTDFFNVQPPTKTFEYLLSGMPVIATDTFENHAVITLDNGILINDSSGDFYKGLIRMYENLSKYDSNAIRLNAQPYTWRKIVAGLQSKLIRIQTRAENGDLKR